MDDYSDRTQNMARRRLARGVPSAPSLEKGPDLFDSPPAPSRSTPRARKSDPVTSHRAAEAAADGDAVSLLQVHILDILLQSEGATDDEIYSYYLSGRHPKRTPQRLRTARADLVELKWVADSGSTAPSAVGNDATIWVPTHRAVKLLATAIRCAKCGQSFSAHARGDEGTCRRPVFPGLTG